MCGKDADVRLAADRMCLVNIATHSARWESNRQFFSLIIGSRCMHCGSHTVLSWACFHQQGFINGGYQWPAKILLLSSIGCRIAQFHSNKG